MAWLSQVLSTRHDTVNPVNDTKMEDLLEGTIRKIERFKKLGFRVEVKWECEFKQELTTNPEMKSFVKSLKFDTPLIPGTRFSVDVQTLSLFTRK